MTCCKAQKVVEEPIVKAKLFLDDSYILVGKDVPAFPGSGKNFDLLFEGQAMKRNIAIEEKELHSMELEPQFQEQFWNRIEEIRAVLTEAGYSGYLIPIRRDDWKKILLNERSGTSTLRDGLLEYLLANEDTFLPVDVNQPVPTHSFGFTDVEGNVVERLEPLIEKANKQLPPVPDVRRIFLVTGKHLFLDLEETKRILHGLEIQKKYPNVDEIWVFDEYSMKVAGRPIAEMESEKDWENATEVKPKFECVYRKTGS